MKLLIWVACAFVLSLITVSLKYAGILLGFIPTFILGSLTFWTARTLCKKWDKRKLKQKRILIANKSTDRRKCRYEVYMLIVSIFIPLLVSLRIFAESNGFDIGIFYIVNDCLALLILPVVLFVLVIKNNRMSKINLNVLSAISIVAALLSIILQDPEKCIEEIMNPTILYVFIIVTNVCMLIIVNIKNFKYDMVVASIITILLAISSCFSMYEGSMFSNSSRSWNGILNFYQNADLVYAIDMFWFVSSFVMCALTMLPLMIRAPQNILQKYYSSMKYREKCYKKVADMQVYLEKGIITQEEFEKNKNDILKRIKTGVSNNSPKTETTNTKKIDEEKTIPNEEESTKSVDKKELTPLVRNEAFWEKVKTIYSNLYQENGQVFFQSLAKAELLNFNEETNNFELDIFDDGVMQRTSIYGAEFDRFIGYVFKTWMKHKIPEMDAKENLKIIEIMSSHFNINDPYIKEIAPDVLNRWNDFDKINIEDCLYGFYEGSGHKVELDEKIDEDSRELFGTFDAMRWIMTDLIYTTSKTSKTFSYNKVVEYLKDNHIAWKDSDDKEAALDSMKMIDIYCNLSDVYLSVVQTVNWIASNKFMN